MRFIIRLTVNRLNVICFFLFCTLANLCADGVSVHLSQRKVSLNDAFTVTFSTDRPLKDTPDFTPLEADFDIVSKSHDNSIAIINGQVSQETRWNLVLISKREGNLVIPSIRFGDYSSSPQAIEVIKGIAVKRDNDIYLETELSPKDFVYEQALLTYTVRLYCSVKMAQASLSDIALNDKDAIVERLGNDIEYDHYNKNGKYYRVYERKYVVSPQHPGELVFSPIVFEGAIISGNNFFFDIQTKMKRLVSDKQTIAVSAIPTPFQKHNWLPANEVTLTEEWSSDPDNMKVGEPITWTLKIAAAGCLGNQIPDVAIEFPNSLKHYLDKPEISNQITENGIIGTRQIKVALIAAQPGKVELPKIDIRWWDLKTGTVRHTELPERTLNIKDSNIAMNPSPEPAINSADVQAAFPPLSEVIPQKEHFSIQSILAISGTIAIFLVALLWILYRKYSAKSNKKILRKIKKDLKKACKEGNAKQAEAALLTLFKQISPSSKHFNLLILKNSLNGELQTAVLELYQALYSQNSTWSGETLWKAFKAHRPDKKHNAKKNETLLPKLYS